MLIKNGFVFIGEGNEAQSNAQFNDLLQHYPSFSRVAATAAADMFKNATPGQAVYVETSSAIVLTGPMYDYGYPAVFYKEKGYGSDNVTDAEFEFQHLGTASSTYVNFNININRLFAGMNNQEDIRLLSLEIEAFLRATPAPSDSVFCVNRYRVANGGAMYIFMFRKNTKGTTAAPNTYTVAVQLEKFYVETSAFAKANGFKFPREYQHSALEEITGSNKNLNGREIASVRFKVVGGYVHSHEVLSIHEYHVALPQLKDNDDSFKASGSDILVLFGAYCQKNGILSIGANVMASLVAIAAIDRSVIITIKRDGLSIVGVNLQ